MKNLHMHLERCFECPYADQDGPNRTVCGNPVILARIVEKPHEVGGIPAWCPLPEVDAGSPVDVALRDPRSLTEDRLALAIVAELLPLTHNGQVNERAVILQREAERRLTHGPEVKPPDVHFFAKDQEALDAAIDHVAEAMTEERKPYRIG